MTSGTGVDQWDRARCVAGIAGRARARVAALVAVGSPGLEATADRALALLDARMPGREYHQLPAEYAALASAEPSLGQLVCARALSQAEERIARQAVPDAVVREIDKVTDRLLGMDALPAASDVFQKDLSMSMVLSFPCVAQVVEQAGGVPRSLLAGGGFGQAMQLGAYLLRVGNRRNYLQIHTHTPMLDGFNPAGWQRCFELTAALLAERPDCPGMIGSSWFYDPKVAEISPRLAYLSEMPLAGGAFRVRVGSSPKDVDLATSTSSTRRELVEKGLYTPTSFAMIWPRAQMLAWHRTQPK